MSFESLMATSQRLSASVEALTALGAELRWRQEGLEGDARVRNLLQNVVNAVDPRLLGGIDPDREASVLALIQTIFPEAVDLLENPGCVPSRAIFSEASHLRNLSNGTLGRNGSLPCGWLSGRFGWFRYSTFAETLGALGSIDFAAR
jgi:hypothetical protein